MAWLRGMAHDGGNGVRRSGRSLRGKDGLESRSSSCDVQDGGSLRDDDGLPFPDIENSSSYNTANRAICDPDETSSPTPPATCPSRIGRGSNLTTWTTQTPQPLSRGPRSQPAEGEGTRFISRLRRVKTSVSDLSRKFYIRGSQRTQPESRTSPIAPAAAATTAVTVENIAAQNNAHLANLDFSLLQRRTRGQMDLCDAEVEERTISAIIATAGTGAPTAATVTTATTTASTGVEGLMPPTSSISGGDSETEKGDAGARMNFDKGEKPTTHASQAYVSVSRGGRGRGYVFDEGEATRIQLQAEIFEKLHRYNKVDPPRYLEMTAREADLYRRKQARPYEVWRRLHEGVGVAGGSDSGNGSGGERGSGHRQRGKGISRKEEILREEEGSEILRGPERPGVYVPIFRRRKSQKEEKSEVTGLGWLGRRFAATARRRELERILAAEEVRETRSRDEVTVSTREVEDYDSGEEEWYVEYKKVRAVNPLGVMIRRLLYEH